MGGPQGPQGPQQNGVLPDDLKAMMDKYIREETTRILQAGQPQAAPELTVEEKARLYLVRAAQLEAGEKSRPSSSGPTHGVILSLLSILVDKAFPTTGENTSTDSNGTYSDVPLVIVPRSGGNN